jgi:adenylosuccinate lyase
MKVWEKKTMLLDELKNDEETTSILSSEELDKIFNVQKRLKNIDIIFKRLELL